MNAASLAAHAVVALENARLHGMVERQALVDGLTGLANRRAASDALHAEAARAERLETPLSIVLADLDGFKDVNDAHGHAVGDEVLQAFADVLRETLRESDVAGRWGGEEFLLLLPGADAEGRRSSPSASVSASRRADNPERSGSPRDRELRRGRVRGGVEHRAAASRPPTARSTGPSAPGKDRVERAARAAF